MYVVDIQKIHKRVVQLVELSLQIIKFVDPEMRP